MGFLWADVFTPVSAQLNRAAFLPAADVTVSDSDLVLTLDLPGLTADDLEIELADGYLSVRGERKRPEVAQGTRWAHNERTFGRFERRIALPDGIDEQSCAATFRDGLLTVTMKKSEEKRRGRRIPINADTRH